jgi:hypothetical protein
MTEPTDVPPPETPEAATPPALNEVQAARVERTARLAKALRDNLRRRKAVQPKRDKPGN